MHLPRALVISVATPFYRIGLHHRVPARIGRRIMDSSGGVQLVPRGTVVRHVELAGRHAERVTVGATERPRAILYLHGGGYTVGSARLYRALAANLARDSGAVVYNLDYRLAPEHPYPAALDDAVAAFRALVDDHGFAPARIGLAGDSAGGGLAVATARRLVDAGLPPAALGLLSPWTDPSNEAHDISRDRVTNLKWGRISAASYRGSADPRDPGYAPMHGNLAGLPPMLIHLASGEMLRPEILRFAALARQADVDVEVVEHPTWWHSFHVLAGTLREATEAVRDLGTFLRAHLDASRSVSRPA
ncbi:MAG: epsilon-lactone hydrolase [Pseudonocardiales bacterium]|jgi:acetyl esterase/lipase|nr:epsilon-lactone hydrolase [Pseudonocardiales bacterium]